MQEMPYRFARSIFSTNKSQLAGTETYNDVGRCILDPLRIVMGSFTERAVRQLLGSDWRSPQ